MRKLLGLLVLVGVLTVLGPAAAAQPEVVRDPFVPLISPTTAPAAPGVPGGPVATLPPAAPAPTDPLPSTGSSPTPWVGLGYLLVALGAGAVALSRLFGPTPVTTR
jgi:hypothetical protein